MKTLFGMALALALLGALNGSIATASAKPSWGSYQCLLDDGYNRYRPCDAGDGF